MNQQEMKLKKKSLGLMGLELIYPHCHKDTRGYFSEIWRNEWQLPEFKQENESVSKKGTFRGLHYQWDPPQGKLIRVVSGSAVFFELDIRYDSPTFGKCEVIELYERENTWLWVPAGFANSFFALENLTRVIYKCTENWSLNEGSINWRGIPEIEKRIMGDLEFISDKDENAPLFTESIESLQEISGFFSHNSKSIV